MDPVVVAQVGRGTKRGPPTGEGPSEERGDGSLTRPAAPATRDGRIVVKHCPREERWKSPVDWKLPRAWIYEIRNND